MTHQIITTTEDIATGLYLGVLYHGQGGAIRGALAQGVTIQGETTCAVYLPGMGAQGGATQGVSRHHQGRAYLLEDHPGMINLLTVILKVEV